jgi:hypothetical protein
MLRKQRICVNLILDGYYDEAAELIRHIMQSSFMIIYLSKNKNSWKEWFIQQKYEEKKLKYEVYKITKEKKLYLFSSKKDESSLNKELVARGLLPSFSQIDVKKIMDMEEGEIIELSYNEESYFVEIKNSNLNTYENIGIKPKNPNTIFNNFKDLSNTVNHSENYITFQKLCSWSHPSIETMRSSMELTEQVQKHYFTRRYNGEKAEYSLNWIYGFINIAFWEGFKDIFFVDGKIPDTLQKYHDIQEETDKIFDKFYNQTA